MHFQNHCIYKLMRLLLMSSINYALPLKSLRLVSKSINTLFKIQNGLEMEAKSPV